MNRGRLTALSIPALLTVACVGAPAVHNPEIEVTVPEAWTAVAADRGDVHEDWWTDFDDPRLDLLVSIALENNYDLQAAASRVEQAVERATIAGADLKPTVSAGLTGTRQKQNFVGFPVGDGVLTTQSTRLGLSLDIAWEVDLWGRLRAGARASVAELQATEADYRAAQLSLTGLTAKIWFAVAEAREQADLARRSADSFRRTADQIRDRYLAGLRPPIDLRLALSNLAAAEAQFEVRERQTDALVRQLEILLGNYPAAELLEEFEVEALPSTPPPIPAGLPADLVARRPDLHGQRSTDRPARR